jgi:hypothetical protein
MLVMKPNPVMNTLGMWERIQFQDWRGATLGIAELKPDQSRRG